MALIFFFYKKIFIHFIHDNNQNRFETFWLFIYPCLFKNISDSVTSYFARNRFYLSTFVTKYSLKSQITIQYDTRLLRYVSIETCLLEAIYKKTIYHAYDIFFHSANNIRRSAPVVGISLGTKKIKLFHV